MRLEYNEGMLRITEIEAIHENELYGNKEDEYSLEIELQRL